MKNLSEPAYPDERHRGMSGSISEDSSNTKKISDKGRTHSFILELEQGSQEALRQRSVGKFDRLSHRELHSKERKERERSLSDERAKLKQKQEKKPEHQVDETQQKEGIAVKVASEEKGEKKPKIKTEKKMAGSIREGKVCESTAEEGGSKEPKKVKTVEAAKAEKDKNKDKDKIKEKVKGEKTLGKSDFKQLLRPDSAGSSEDRSDMEPESNSGKKKDKHSKEVTKKPKSHSEDGPGEKAKSKSENKDGEKEKPKVDPDSQKLNKSSSESDKDPKRVKSTDKGKTLEKSKSKSKEEAKTPLLSKTEKKVQSPEVKSSGGASTSKPEATKEKKKDQSRVSEEASQERSDKSAKKKLEKKEKKDESQEEKVPREEKPEKPEKSSLVSSLGLETDEPLHKQPALQDTSTDSDPVTTTVTTLFSDDTCDALSDITPEPPEGETESRLCEMPAVPAEADALLTLMDVCTSAEARLPPESARQDVTSEMALQDADMKMKEAALTLLSMDPDSTVSTSLLCHETREEPVIDTPAPYPMEMTTAEEEQLLPMEEETAAETSPVAPQQIDVLADGRSDFAGLWQSAYYWLYKRVRMNES